MISHLAMGMPSPQCRDAKNRAAERQAGDLAAAADVAGDERDRAMAQCRYEYVPAQQSRCLVSMHLSPLLKPLLSITGTKSTSFSNSALSESATREVPGTPQKQCAK